MSESCFIELTKLDHSEDKIFKPVLVNFAHVKLIEPTNNGTTTWIIFDERNKYEHQSTIEVKDSYDEILKILMYLARTKEKVIRLCHLK